LNMSHARWIKRIVQWRPRLRKASVSRPQKCWLDNIREKAGRTWHQMAFNKEAWKNEGVDHERLLKEEE